MEDKKTQDNFLKVALVALALYFICRWVSQGQGAKSSFTGQTDGIIMQGFVNENNAPLFYGRNLEQMKTSLNKGDKVTILLTLGEYYKIDCDGIYIRKSNVNLK